MALFGFHEWLLECASSVLRNEILKKERLTRDDPFDLRCAQSLFYEPPLARGGTTGACQDSDLRRRAGYKSERTRRTALIVLVRRGLGFPMAFHMAGGSSHGALPWIRCRLELAKNISTVFARKRWMKFGPVFFRMHIVLVPDAPSLVGMINHMASLEFALNPFLLCMWSLCVWASMCSVSLSRTNPTNRVSGEGKTNTLATGHSTENQTKNNSHCDDFSKAPNTKGATARCHHVSHNLTTPASEWCLSSHNSTSLHSQ